MTNPKEQTTPPQGKVNLAFNIYGIVMCDILETYKKFLIDAQKSITPETDTEKITDVVIKLAVMSEQVEDLLSMVS